MMIPISISQPLILAQPSTTTVPRRLPPPCWSNDETIALIDSYRTKWYSLRRGNLRASHWQEVADSVGSICPVDIPKTSVQCRHKMEKLRKRYRGEIARAGEMRRYCSSWVHFARMDAMEKGVELSEYLRNQNQIFNMEKGSSGVSQYQLNQNQVVKVEKGASVMSYGQNQNQNHMIGVNVNNHGKGHEEFDDDEEDEDEEEDDEEEDVKGKSFMYAQSGQRYYGGGNNVMGMGMGGKPSCYTVPGGVRIKISGRDGGQETPMASIYGGGHANNKYDEYPSAIPNPNYPNYGFGKSGGIGGGVKRRAGSDDRIGNNGFNNNGNKGNEDSSSSGVMDEMVNAIKMLGEGFVKVERMKMDMAREMEKMRMEMEMKRTEMILESQERILETFTKSLLESSNKKAKKMPTPEES